MTKTKVAQQDLGLIPLDPKHAVFAINLPSTATGIIVKYDGDAADIDFDDDDDHEYCQENCAIMVTCSTPPQKLELLVSNAGASRSQTAKQALELYTKQKIKVPATLLTMGLVDIPTQQTVLEKIASYYLFAHNTKNKEKIEGLAYGISNVYCDGGICFGDFKPGSLREANNTFWNSPFNCELADEHSELFDDMDEDDLDDLDTDKYMRMFSKRIKDAKWSNLTQILCGEKFWASPTGAQAILVSENPALLEKIPREFWRKHRDKPIIIAKVNRQEDQNWLCESGGFKFSLASDSVTTKTVKKQPKRYGS